MYRAVVCAEKIDQNAMFALNFKPVEMDEKEYKRVLK